jgi:hypothetical protein
MLRRMHDPEICLTVSGLESGTVVESTPEGVTFLCAPSARELVALFDSHDLLIVPSGVGAGGLPEALSRGIPCVTVRSCTMSDAVVSGVTGAVIDDGSPHELAAGIASVLEDDGIYRSCFERAPAMAAYFSWMRLPYGDLPHLPARAGNDRSRCILALRSITRRPLWISCSGPVDLRLALLNRQYRADPGGTCHPNMRVACAAQA